MGGNERLAAVLNHYKEIGTLDSVASLLHWDHRAMMPPKGLEVRTEANALIERLMHERLTHPPFVENVHLLADEADSLHEDDRVCIREIKREVDRAVKVPPELVEELSRQGTRSHAAWVKAREASDFSSFAPYLSRMVDLRIAEAEALGFSDRPYDAMLDRFEPAADEAGTTAVFADLRSRLVPFVQKVLDKPGRSAAMIRGPEFPVEKQRRFGLDVIGRMGFDFDAGRQDTSAHPFCSGTLGDVRITTRFDPKDLSKALFGMIHEAGHALYEQGLDASRKGTPLAESISMAIHESQSRLWENMVGRSLPFWEHMLPVLRTTFPEALGEKNLEDFYRAINIIEGSLIRVEADEATYQLHVILRFEIESDLVNRRVTVQDLPALWNAKMEKYLGVKVPNDADGVLQDVHWSEGLFGYFPTYALGNLYCAQFFAQAKKDVGDLEAQIGRGDFSGLLTWLRENIHGLGKRYRAADLVKRVTGDDLSAGPFMDYLEEKFVPLYDL